MGASFAPRLAHRDRVVRADRHAWIGARSCLAAWRWYWGVGVARRLALPTDFDFVVLFGVRLIGDASHRPRHLSLAMVGGIGLLLSRTRIGLGMRALASDRHISAAIGVRVVQIDSIAWLVNGMFAGIAGILLANINRLDPGTLTFLVIPAIAAAIMARLSSLPGAFVGGMVAGLIEALLIATSPEIANLRSAGPYIAALIFLMIVGAGQGVGARE